MAGIYLGQNIKRGSIDIKYFETKVSQNQGVQGGIDNQVFSHHEYCSIKINTLQKKSRYELAQYKYAIILCDLIFPVVIKIHSLQLKLN